MGEGACLFEVGGVICSVLGCNRIVLGTTLVANKCDMADLTGCDVCREELITPGCCAGPTKILPWKSGTPEAVAMAAGVITTLGWVTLQVSTPSAFKWVEVTRTALEPDAKNCVRKGTW